MKVVLAMAAVFFLACAIVGRSNPAPLPDPDLLADPVAVAYRVRVLDNQVSELRHELESLKGSR